MAKVGRDLKITKWPLMIVQGQYDLTTLSCVATLLVIPALPMAEVLVTKGGSVPTGRAER
jgi:hypothetical protein